MQRGNQRHQSIGDPDHVTVPPRQSFVLSR
jgi:hypothetical protein